MSESIAFLGEVYLCLPVKKGLNWLCGVILIRDEYITQFCGDSLFHKP